MKISLNWIKDFVDIPSKYTPKQLAELLTLRTAEVEEYHNQAKGLEGVLVGEMLEFSKHPDADKLNVAKVNIGRREPLQLIFGQMVKMNVGDRIPVAVAPTTLPTGIKIEAKNLRGVRSEGMLCLEQELGFKETGISILYFPTTKPGTPLAEALGMDDVIFEIDNKSLTHRPDLWGHYGMAREFAAFLGKKLKPFITKTPGTKTGKGLRVKVTLTKPDIAARFLSVIISGIKIGPSPDWMQKRLEAVGMRPVNNIVDITNYVMHELGHPLHAFDRRTVSNDQFVIRHAKQNEAIETLDHKKRRLHPEDALVTNGDTALGIAGVMGGLNSEITADTTEIILEVATWNPVLIRKTAQRHSLRSDAAQRFEKSLDPEVSGFAFHRAVELILKLCSGARLAGPVTDVYPKRAKPATILLDTKRVERKIGVSISEKEIAAYLKALEFTVKRAKKGTLHVTIPTFRTTKDINIEDDLVEEVARMHGYEKIPAILPHLPIRLPEPHRERILKHEARDIFSLGLGFTETSLYSFYGIPEIKKALLPEEIHVQIQNPLTADQTHLRISLLPNLLKAVAQNITRKDEFKIYEVGRTYVKAAEDLAYRQAGSRGQQRIAGTEFPREEKFICGVIVQKKPRGEVFYDALGALKTFLDYFQVKQYETTPAETPPPYAHPSKCATVKLENQEIATVYELHPQVLKNFDIAISVAAFEINFTTLVTTGQREVKYTLLPRFPGISIDISVVVPKRTPLREMNELIRHAEQNLIASIGMVGEPFEDKSLGEDKKSVTIHVLLQSPDRTLTDDEMKEVQNRIFETLKESGFAIRGLVQ